MRARAYALACSLAACPAAAQNSSIEISQDSLNEMIRWLGDPSDGGVYTPTTVGLTGGATECEFFGYLDCPQPVSPEPVEASASARPQPEKTGSLRAVERIGIAQCRTLQGGWLTVPTPGPVSWRWWVTEARVEALSGSLRFSAKVEYKVGSRWGSSQKTVAAGLAFDATSNGLRLEVRDFKVPLDYEFEGERQGILVVDVTKLYRLSVLIPPQKLQVPRPGLQTRTVTARALSAVPHYEPGRIRVDLDVGFQ